ncbi:M10 family metallopeptidase C-terminal domain-containing protein [Azohydromonas australica]|uniref:M10 family metallopeptidase C-terminal domain-containing protein n=1 Tax=Azohydromonas australica TaxID=364039 RepID=UPI0004205FDB|nr:M10 family metallopeptidase C-terminal domain-containing protein [Azohydromonas australica]
MGDYNGGGALPGSFQASQVYSIMSYFGPEGSAPYVDPAVQQADWTGPDGIAYSAQTPMLSDVLAIQSIYGVSTTTRTGNTVYGFNYNADPGRAELYDFSLNLHPILTIFDSAGNDTLDLSGWSTSSTIFLEAGKFLVLQ